jgi:transcriptional regulator with XRE-family HTH domain
MSGGLQTSRHALPGVHLLDAELALQDARERLSDRLNGDEGAITHSRCTKGCTTNAAPSQAGAGEKPDQAEAARLDSLANSVSTHPHTRTWKARRHRLRHVAGSIVGGRQAACGTAAVGQTVSIAVGHGRAELHGLETCGSVWTCPVCAAKVTERRKQEVQTVKARHQARGGRVAMATLTLPHYAFDRCGDLLDVVRGSYRKVKQGRSWAGGYTIHRNAAKRLRRARLERGVNQAATAEATYIGMQALQAIEEGHRKPAQAEVTALCEFLGVPLQEVATWRPGVRERTGWAGDIRALEVLHGGNGWHPHLHVLVFFEAGTSDGQMEEFSAWLWQRWSRIVGRQTGRECSERAFEWRELSEDEDGGYLEKWGAAEELTKAHVKNASAGRTPWQLLASIADGDDPRQVARDRSLFLDYAQAFKGARQLTWSGGLRDRYLSDQADQADEEVAAEEELQPGEEVEESYLVHLDRAIWKPLARAGLQAALIDAADPDQGGGLRAVLDVIERAGVRFRMSQERSMVPHLYPP